jgi:hypothetical protein
LAPGAEGGIRATAAGAVTGAGLISGAKDGSEANGHAVAGRGEGNGICGMRERAAAAGGQLTAGPRPCGGFEVTATLPIATDGDMDGTTAGVSAETPGAGFGRVSTGAGTARAGAEAGSAEAARTGRGAR